MNDQDLCKKNCTDCGRIWCVYYKPRAEKGDTKGGSMSEKLKPCPFCGNKAVEIHDVYDTINGESYKGKTVLCNFDKGGCGAECGIRTTEADAVEAWNKRTFNDIHKDTASAVFDSPQNEVTSEQRNVAKAVNFGIMYGRAEWQR